MLRASVLFAATLGSTIVSCSLFLSTGDLSSGSGDAPDAARVLDAPAGPTDALSGERVDGGIAPFGEWLFEETSGSTAADTSGNDRTGQLLDGATFASDPTRGRVVQLGGGAGRVRVNGLMNAAFPRSGTLSIWFRWRAASAADHIGIFDLYGNGREHIFLRHPNGTEVENYQVAYQAASGAYRFSVNFDVATQKWTHAVMTWDEANAIGAVYVDGILRGKTSYEAPFAPIGQDFTVGENLDGAIDDMRLWNVPLPESAILGLR